jgi:cardiolipin synthase
MIASSAAASKGNSGFVPGNQVTPLQNGEAFFPAIEQAFDRARVEIYLQRIAAALKRLVLRGVRVFVVVDGYGASDFPDALLDQMRQDGIELRIFRPGISPWTLRRKRLRRMHRKIVVVDQEIAFVGGMNIVDDRAAACEMAARYDYAVAVEGPLVEVISNFTIQLWSLVAAGTFLRRVHRTSEMPASTLCGGAMRAAFLV